MSGLLKTTYTNNSHIGHDEIGLIWNQAGNRAINECYSELHTKYLTEWRQGSDVLWVSIFHLQQNEPQL